MKTNLTRRATVRFAFAWLFFFSLTNNSYSQIWNYVGSPSFSEGSIDNPSLAINNGTPYLAYTDGSNGNKATVKKFDGANWVTVGNAGFSAGAAGYVKLVFNGNTPYVAFTDGGNGTRARLMKFDGVNWVTVGAAGISAGQAWSATLAFEGNTPYVGYLDVANGYKATIKKFDGTNWVLVGPQAFSFGIPAFMSIAFVGSTPYVAYRDQDLSFMVVAKKFDGANWVTVGPESGVSGGNTNYCDLVVHNGVPYIAYRESTSFATVKKFDGANWVPVGKAGFSPGVMNACSFVFEGNTPYLAFTNGLANPTVMKFDGTNWVLVGKQGFSTATSFFISLAFNGTTPYVAYMEGGNGGNKATVAKFDGTPATGLNFDGIDDYVRVPDNWTLDFGSNNFTVECWTMKLASSSNYSNSGVAGKWNTSTAAGTNEWLLQNTSDGNNNRPAFSIESGTTTYTVSGTTSMALNTWYHLAAVRDGSILKLYVNGALEGSINLPVNTTINNVGQHLNMAAYGFTANSVIYSRINLDEFRIWNRALCRDELQANMNCTLNAAGQSGVAALFNFNQGTVGYDNSGITDLINKGNLFNVLGTLNNFALTGSTSNWMNGKAVNNCSVFSPAGTAATAGGSRVCQSTRVQTPGTIFQDAACNYIAKVNPSGAVPVNGTVNACVAIDATVQKYWGVPYVQRHYDIEPVSGAASATGTITLLFTQPEFDAYNAVRGNLPALPTGPGDASGITNLRIIQYHGTGTAPGNYSGSTVEINPADANIVWNGNQQRWEVTFDVTGFSGFYVRTIIGTLPLKLLNFTANKAGDVNLLKWTTTEELNTSEFDVERNTGNGFEKIGSVHAAGNSSQLLNYVFEDKHPSTSRNHYRLKMVDKDGYSEYSKTVSVKADGREDISIYPNPAQSKLYVAGAANGSLYHVKNSSGQVITSGRLNITTGINVSSLPTGMYILIVNGAPLKFFKQ
jgi:hypothetical protein